jgi:hypothetical protein
MLEFSRPDVTTEGWHTWPTEKVSHVLVRDPRSRAAVQAHAAVVLETMPPDVAALALVPTVRDVIESGLRYGEAEELRESLMTFAQLRNPLRGRLLQGGSPALPLGPPAERRVEAQPVGGKVVVRHVAKHRRAPDRRPEAFSPLAA